MLDLYGVRGERRDALIQVAREARQKGWWQAYSDTLVVPLVGLEVAATSIDIYEISVVPGLLQTSDYAEAVIRKVRSDLPRERVERWVELRMARQELLRREEPPGIRVVLDEAVVLRLSSGHDVLRRQLHHLVEVAELPAITLQVLPLAAGVHAGMSGAFTLFRFGESQDPDVVYLEHSTSDVYLESAEDVQRYERMFEALVKEALKPDDSMTLIADLATKR